MTPKPDQNPSIDRILRAARDLFVTVGYPSTSMELIARRAKVVRATIYNNFADKEALLAAIMRDYLDQYAAIPQRLGTPRSPNDDSFELIERFIREAVRVRLENAELRPLVQLCKHLRLEEWEDGNVGADVAMQSWLLKVHLHDAELGMLRPGLDIEFATSALYRMIEGVLASFPVETDPSDVLRVTRQLALLHWYALYQEPAPVSVEELGNELPSTEHSN